MQLSIWYILLLRNSFEAGQQGVSGLAIMGFYTYYACERLKYF
jgi:hypothetical protein